MIAALFQTLLALAFIGGTLAAILSLIDSAIIFASHWRTLHSKTDGVEAL